MKLITLLATLALAAPLSAQFSSWIRPWTWGEPACIVNGEIAPRDDTRHRGQVCDPWELNVPGALESHLTLAQIANVKNWSALSDARKTNAFRPTTAQWNNALIGLTTMSPDELSTREQAERYKARLEGLAARAGMSCRLAIYEQDRALTGGFPQYNDEKRRVFYLHRAGEDPHHRSGQLVSTILLSYMSYAEETSDQRMTDGLRYLCAATSERMELRRR